MLEAHIPEQRSATRDRRRVASSISSNYYVKIAAANEKTSEDKAIDANLIWSYDDESKWPGKLCQSGGKRQSPIDIRTDLAVRDFTKQFIKYGPLRFTGYHKVLTTGINNGHTIQFSTEGEDAMHPMVSGGPLKNRYRLEQLHFHWLSEHSVNGIKFPMEIHFVHVRADLTVNQALHRKDGLAIVSVFVNVQSELEDNELQMGEVMEYIPKLMRTGARLSGVLLDMSKLLDIDKSSYYTYSGSLTSPDCNEAVVWIIFTTPIFLTDTQPSVVITAKPCFVEKALNLVNCNGIICDRSANEYTDYLMYRLFAKIGIGRHNFRSLQKQNQQVVYMPAKTKIKVPQVVKFFVDVGKAFSDFFVPIWHLVFLHGHVVKAQKTLNLLTLKKRCLCKDSYSNGGYRLWPKCTSAFLFSRFLNEDPLERYGECSRMLVYTLESEPRVTSITLGG
ncbi:unnamed protein product [Spodoptera exigua]|nr:unnamed protein product [Spodoptera exigua]